MRARALVRCAQWSCAAASSAACVGSVRLRLRAQAVHTCAHSKLQVLQGNDMERTQNLMSASLNKLNDLVKYAGGSTHMCALIAFVVLLFLGLWFLLKK